MTLEQEQVYLWSQAQMVGYQRQISLNFELWCNGAMTTEAYVKELRDTNARIDICLENLLQAGVYNEHDLDVLHYGKTIEELMDELGER